MPSSWENTIDSHFRLCTFALDTGHPSILHNLLVQDVYYDDESLDSATAEKLKGIVQDTATQCKDKGYSPLESKINGLKQKGEKDKEAWEKTLDEGVDAGKAATDKAWEDFRVRSKKTISELPQSARQPAANWLKNGITSLAAFIDTIRGWFVNLFNAIGEFLKGVWNKLKQAGQAIADGYHAVLKFLHIGSYYEADALNYSVTTATTGEKKPQAEQIGELLVKMLEGRA